MIGLWSSKKKKKKPSKFNAFKKYISLKDSVVFTYVAYDVLNL